MKPENRATQFSGLVGKAYANVLEEIRKLPKEPISKALLDLKGKTPAVYLFWNPKGELLYVGCTGNLKTRIKAHLKPDQMGLLWYVLMASGIQRPLEGKGHVCKCGERTICLGGDPFPYDPPAIQLISTVRTRYLLSYVEMDNEELSEEGRSLERYLQMCLLPKHGKIPYWDPEGWKSIPDLEMKEPPPEQVFRYPVGRKGNICTRPDPITKREELQ